MIAALGATLLALAGCAQSPPPQPRQSERWPLVMTLMPVPVHDFAWRSPGDPRCLVMIREEITLGGPIAALCDTLDSSEDAWLITGLVAFHGGGAERVDTLTHEHRPLALPEGMAPVRAAQTLFLANAIGPVHVLLVGGATDTSVAEAEAEPPPWLLGGELRLAWVEGESLIVGEPEEPSGENPYRIRAGVFAGELNLLVFVYNRAPFDQVMRRRPWIYRVVEGEDGRPHLQPRWRGTSFAHPLRDATFGDLTGAGAGEIAALEVDRDGGRLLTAYHFEGFGLEGLAPSVKLAETEDRIEAADWVGGEAQELVVRTADGQFVFYGLDAAAETLTEVLRVDGPREVLGWLVTDQHGGEPGDIVCLLPDGGTWRAYSWEYREQAGAD